MEEEAHVRKLIVSGLLLMTTAVAAMTASPAAATPLGVNGQITYDINGGDGVVTANPDGSGASLLVPSTCCADFSPDGSKLTVPYLTADGRIGPATVNADGTGYTQFPIADPTLNIGCGTGSWSPDAKRLACETWDDSNPSRDGIYTISSADGSGLTRVTSNPLGGHDIPGAYSPDGGRIVFLRSDANMNSAGMFVVKTNDGQLRQILPTSMILNIGADWSPKGDEILFSRHVTPDVLGSIWVVHANGTGLRPILIRGLDCGTSYSDPSGVGCHGARWSPDGKKIIFAAFSPAIGTNIYTANADGTGLTQVTFDGSDDDPAWGTHPLATGTSAVAQRLAASIATRSSGSPSIVGRWETVKTCQGDVASARLAGLGPIAPTIVGDFFPGKSTQQLARKRDLCSGARPQAHSHFFTRNGAFGSLDQNGQQVDNGTYHVINDHIIRINRVRFRYRIASGHLSLVPMLSKKVKRETLAHPLNFNDAVWSVAMSYLGHRWHRVPCGRC
jgi:Tol biopolymer transport system component